MMNLQSPPWRLFYAVGPDLIHESSERIQASPHVRPQASYINYMHRVAAAPISAYED